MKLNRIYEAVNRRQFMNTMGKASAAVGVNPAGSLSSLSKLGKVAANISAPKKLVDLFASMTDEELLGLPEMARKTTLSDEELSQDGDRSGWMDKIPKARLNRIIKNNPKYVAQELGNKIYNIMQYGGSHKQSGTIISILAKIGAQAGHNMPALFSSADKGQLVNGWLFNDYEDIVDHYESGNWLSSEIATILDKNGIKLGREELGRLYGYENKIKKTGAEKRAKEDKEDAQRIEKNRQEQRDRLRDAQLASSMHQPFEHKLALALSNLI